MRIAFIGQKGIGPGAPVGGVEVYVEELATRLVRAGHAVTVFCRGPRRVRPSSGQSGGGVGLETVPTLRGTLFAAVTSSFFATLAAGRGHFDIIHFQGIGPGFFTWLARLLAPRTKVVVTFHSRDYEHTKWPWFGKLFFKLGEWVTIRGAHGVVAVARHIQEYVRQRYGRDIAYIPQGVALPIPASFPPLARKFGLTAKRYILAVGRLEPHKGFGTLIAAYRALPADLKAIYKLVLVGGGAAAYEQELQVAAAGEPGIVLTGSQPRSVAAALMRQAYIFVLASASEGLSIALLEALAAGRPALVSAIPANQEIVTDRAWQFLVNDPAALTKRLAQLLASPAIVEHAVHTMARRIRANHAWPQVFKQYEAVYRNLLA